MDLIADIGGTNTRCALVRDGRITGVRRLRNADFTGLSEVLLHYLAELGRPGAPEAVALSVAAPVIEDRIALTNLRWSFSRRTLATTLGARRLHVVNDYTALAWSLPHLRADDTVAIGGGSADPRAPRAVIGPGTGLGTGALVPTDDGDWTAVPGEGGHVTLAAANAREAAVIAHVRERVGHVSAERLLSGPGLALLYRTLAELDGVRATTPDPAQVTAAAAAGDARADEALELFLCMLATTTADLALTLGARGGVYLAGGILPVFPDRVRASGFRARFEDKGRYAGYLATIPVRLITCEEPAFPGLREIIRRGRPPLDPGR